MLGERHNDAPHVPIGKHLLALSHGQFKGMRAHDAPDRETANPVGDVNQPVHNLEIRRRLQKDRGVKVLTRHSLAPRLRVLTRPARLTEVKVNASCPKTAFDERVAA